MRVIREQLSELAPPTATVVDPLRLRRTAGRLSVWELRAVDEALALILGL